MMGCGVTQPKAKTSYGYHNNIDYWPTTAHKVIFSIVNYCGSQKRWSLMQSTLGKKRKAYIYLIYFTLQQP